MSSASAEMRPSAAGRSRLRLWPRTVRYQLIVGVALVHLLMMTVFVVDLVARQRRFLRAQSLEQTQALAGVLAVNSSSWILANDLVGLGEVVEALRRDPAVRYAMVVAPDGRVLAHTEVRLLGQVLTDPESRAVLGASPGVRIVAADAELVDVAAPVLRSDGELSGWARVATSRREIAESLSGVTRNGLLYTLVAILLGSVCALLIGSRLTAGLHDLLRVSSQVRDGRLDVRARLSGEGEVAALGRGLNEMLDAIVAGEERVHLLLDSTMEGIFGLDVEGNCTFCNAAALALLGYSRPEDLLGRQLHERIHHHRADGSDYPRSECPTCAVTELRGEIHREDETFWRADGTALSVEYRCNPILRSGQRVGSVVTFSDVTERRKAWAVRAHLAAIIESSSDAILGKDLDGMVTSWNPGAERMYGWSAAEMLGRSISGLAPEGRSDEVAVLIEKVRQGALVERYETVRIARDGRRMDVSLALSPIRDAAGTIVGVSTIARDVTEARRAAEEVRRMNELLERRVRERTAELETVNQELEAFSYSVSHDLRAPIRAIDGFGRLLEEESGRLLNDEGRSHLSRIQDAARRMGQLIDDLLRLSRLGRASLSREPVSLSRLAAEIAGEIRASDPGRVVDFEIEPGLEAEADSNLTRVLLDNLLRNAWKFTAKRPVSHIELGSRVEDGSTIYFVRDNGVGFDMAFVGQLFQPFHRLHLAAEFEGTGIGLAIVWRIVRRHGGRVWAEGKVGQGATISFTLAP